MTAQLHNLVTRYIGIHYDLKELAKRKKDLTAENNDLKEQIIELMQAENTNKIELGNNEITLKISKRTKSPTVGDVIILMEDQLKAATAETPTPFCKEFVENFMDDFIASVESQKDVTETDTLHVKQR